MSKAVDFNQAPWVVIWEVTQACGLACVHCRASAQPRRDPRELSMEEGKQLLREVHELGSPVLVFTGGDPLERPDIPDLVRYAREIGLAPALTPSATPRLTEAAVSSLADAGLARLALSLDGATAATHDRFRGVSGSFAQTLAAVGWARSLGLEVQINTTVAHSNLHELEAIADLLDPWGISTWSVFFLVPTGRANAAEMLNAEESEAAFERLYAVARRNRFPVRTTEALHYRRYLLQRKREGAPQTAPNPWAPRSLPRGISDGSGFVFVSHVGNVYPSGFLPVSAGNVRTEPLAKIYRDSPLFRALRDHDSLHGKCGVCEYRHVCGGSRARAYALTGDWLAADPTCIYEPVRAQAEAMAAEKMGTV